MGPTVSKTIRSTSPETLGETLSNKVMARVDSVLGSEKLLE